MVGSGFAKDARRDSSPLIEVPTRPSSDGLGRKSAGLSEAIGGAGVAFGVSIAGAISGITGFGATFRFGEWPDREPIKY